MKKCKQKKIWLRILALMLVFGVAVVGCNNDSTDENDDGDGKGQNNEPKKITITDFTGTPGSYHILLKEIVSNTQTSNPAQSDSFAFSNSAKTYTFSIKKYGQTTDWTGTGPYVIILEEDGSDSDTGRHWYYYTNGKTWTELGVTTSMNPDVIFKLPKYDISETTSTIAFDKFKPRPDGTNNGDGGGTVGLNGTTWRATNSEGYYIIVTFNSSTNWSMEDNTNNGQIATHTGTYTVSGNTITLTILTFNGSASSGTQTGTISGNTISIAGWPTFTKQ